MKKFWKDYIELCKESVKFYKKHWFGVAMVNIASIAGTFIWLGKDEIKKQLKEKFSKKNESESQ